MNKEWTTTSDIFKHPFTSMIVGPTQSGKTWFIKSWLKYHNILVDREIQRIIFCYSAWQPIFDILATSVQPKIEFINGVFDLEILNPIKNNLIIFDDLMNECEQDNSILKLFTVDSHHKNISVFLISQNLYSKGKHARTISLNSSYIVLFNNKRDQTQIRTLGQQMFPKNFKFFYEAFEDATSSPHGYLLLDLKQSTSKFEMLQTGIFENETRIFYTNKFY